MSTVEASGGWTIVETVPYRAETGAADDESLAVSVAQRDPNRQGWQKMIDTKLIEWGRNPSQLEDEDVSPPSRAIIERANRLAMLLRDEGWAPPQRVVPDADGGIVFERWDGSSFEAIEVYDDGSIVLSSYDSARLVSRKHLV